MRNQILFTSILTASLWTLPASAVNTPNYQVPYFGVAAGYLLTDGVRKSDDGEGVQFSIGVPLQAPDYAVEIRLLDYGYKRFDGEKNFQSGLFVDFVRDFGARDDASERNLLSSIKPFALVGVGFIQEDAFDEKHIHLGANLGGGVMIPMPFYGWALRLDGRVQGQLNKESCEGPAVCEKQANFLVDYQVNLGVQIPLTLFFDRPVSVRPVKDCPVAVVSADGVRSDCVEDSDRDGVSDRRDQCPGTPSGSLVDRQGCPRNKAPADADGDGVVNAQDKCANTPTGLQVNNAGCVTAQRTTIDGVSFDPDSARLTSAGRNTLDAVALSLNEQRSLLLEIVSHTEAVGSDAYNTLLSQQRSDAVRAYLIEKGVNADRLTAVGAGESEPASGNNAVDRAEFRITGG